MKRGRAGGLERFECMLEASLLLFGTFCGLVVAVMGFHDGFIYY